MLEAKYFRDYKHSYMILQCNRKQTEKSYQYRLLTSNKIEEILRCSVRHVNGMAYFYYDISSRVTLENMYRSRKLSLEQVRELFGQLYAIYCKLGDYFMEETKLVLLPEYIYYDFSRKKYIGLYYPDYQEDRPYEALMDFLLEHIDGQDERLADCMYQIYERAEDCEFSLWDALQILGEPEAEKEERIGKIKELKKPVGIEEQKEKTFLASMDPPAEKGNEILLYPYMADSGSGEEEEKAPVKKKSVFYPFLMVLSLCGILVVGYVSVSYDLAEEEMMILFGCGALMAVCFLAGFVGLCRSGKKKEAKRKKETESFPPEKEEEFFPSAEIISLDQVLSKDMASGSAVPKKGTVKRPQGEKEECGNTVFFDSAKLTEYKLYALDKKNKKHIELTKFPYTVGKMAGCVDCVLTDDSVSRIHARFEKVGNVIQMTDMNSTNGTFKNGLRLQPEETVEIEPGDEIRFGNLNYCYR